MPRLSPILLYDNGDSIDDLFEAESSHDSSALDNSISSMDPSEYSTMKKENVEAITRFYSMVVDLSNGKRSSEDYLDDENAHMISIST